MENSQLLDPRIAYSVKKLIAVNSISYCYTELPIDRHCALFGRNNLGKTSLLNALKLHLFPEISFNDCKTKFAFKSSKGELYSSEDSFSYYFPSDSSFLILEAENIHGPFCLILFKSNSSFGYQRLALPCAYEKIRGQFWDIHQQGVNNGLGSPVEDLGIPKILALHTRYKADGAVLLTTKKDIKEKLFSHDPMFNPKKGRYCLVPLKEGGMERELSAFRQLMNFTFEIAKTDSKGLTETFATIIESGKINSQDKLHQDLQIILDEYNSLRQTQNQLKAIGNYRDDFKQLKKISENLCHQNGQFSATFSAYQDYLGQTGLDLTRQTAALEPEVQRLAAEQQELTSTANNQREQSGEFNGQLKALNADMQQLEEKIARYRKIENEYPNFSPAQMREALHAHLAELETDIEHLSDRQKAIDKLSATTQLHKAKIAGREPVKLALEQQDQLLLSQIDAHSALVLSNLNPQFSEIRAVPNTGQQQIIGQFSQLFTTTDTGLLFLGEPLTLGPLKSPQQCKADLQAKLDDLNADIQRLDAEIRKLNGQAKATGEIQKSQVQALEKQALACKADLLVLNAIEDTQQQWQNKSAAIEELENAQRQLSKQREESQNLLLQNQHDHAAAKHQLDGLSTKQREQNGLAQRLQNLRPDELPAAAKITVSSVNSADLVELEAQKAKLLNLTEQLNAHINEFIRCGHFQLPVGQARSSYSLDQQNSILNALENIFAALPVQSENLQSRIIEHNKMTGTKIEELTGNRKHIGTFINKVNKQFENYHISNLHDIQVKIELDHRFEELVNELDKTNLNTTDIHDDALYQRLNQFCEDFFIGVRGNRVLEMSKIITSVKYSYKKAHQDKREEKDQSTGTNALINCTLLTILLKDLLAQDSKLTLPVIFDEFTALDEYNQRTAIKAATEHGFALFCASPTVTAEVAAVVDCYITLDDFHANTIYDAGGERDVVFHHFWERIYEVAEQPAL